MFFRLEPALRNKSLENMLDNFLNCGSDAFRAAAETLHSRIKSWGQTSPALAAWVHRQDLVSKNCRDTVSATIPSSAPAQFPVLLQQDRAYQIAAANFYAHRFEEVRRGFDDISREATSPWTYQSPARAAREHALFQWKQTHALHKPLADQSG